MDIKKDFNKSWGVYQEEDGWYWYDCYGNPSGPYENEDFANWVLDGYELEYSRID